MLAVVWGTRASGGVTMLGPCLCCTHTHLPTAYLDLDRITLCVVIGSVSAEMGSENPSF